MKFEAVDISEVKNARAKRKNLLKFLEEFYNSDAQAAIVHYENVEYKNIESARASLYKSARRYNLGIFVVIRNDKIYLVKEKI